MAYLVLARKYRPQTFEEIVGQEHVTRTLGGALAQGRVHHAFLFCGARGVGKTTAARILAKCLSCERGDPGKPCNQCDACVEITAGTSVDVQEIDGASNNSVDDMRTLRENIRYLPVRGKKKVYIIDEVHMLSTGAFNALLKTLEEPPPHAVFIFATTESHKIPVTILSRVQRYDFRLVSTQRISDHLAKVLTDEKIEFAPGALKVVAREAGGSVRDSLSLLEQVLAVGAATGVSGAAVMSEEAAAEALGVADRGLVDKLARSVLARDAAAALSLVAAGCERNVDLKHLSHVFLEQLRNLVVARVVKDPSSLIEASDNELAELVATARGAGEGVLPMLFERFARIAEEVSRSPLPRFALEVGLVELCEAEPLEPLSDLMDRLEGLEVRLGSASASAPRSPSTTRSAPPRAEAAAPAPASRAEKMREPVSAASVVHAPRVTAGKVAKESAATENAAPRAETSSAPVAAVAGPVAGIRDWNGLSRALAERDMMLGALFLDAEEVEYTAQKIVVALEKDFDVGRANRKLTDATRMVREILGSSSVTLEVRQGRGRAPSNNQADEARQKSEQSEIRQEAIAHPAVKLIKDVFGDEVQFKEPEVRRTRGE